MRGRRLFFSLCLLFAAALAGAEEPPLTRYRVEQIVRLETTSTPDSPPPPGQLWPPPVTTAVEGRFHYVLEHSAAGPAGPARWRLRQVETEGPRTEPAEARQEGVERVFVLGLDWMRNLEGREFAGGLEELPVFPLGETPPPWLATWMQWAQTGNFADRERNPVALPEASYQVEWLRGETRQTLCHVQRARWSQPVADVTASLPAQMADAGVEARTHFSAQSLEWVAQVRPVLIYAERSGVRETYWDMNKVSQPALRDQVLRLRLSVELRLER
ncbi:MAG: hypothetical protein ACRD4D_02580, partial [Candidatus Acidiferrales bacterium]